MSLKQYRSVPDLMQMLVDLQQRVGSLETGKRLGNASIDNGELVIKGGDINVRSDAGNLVTKIQHGIYPTVQYFPGDMADPTDRTSIFGWRPGGNAALQLSVEQIAGDLQRGGKLLLQRDSLYLAVQNSPDGLPEAYLSIGAQGPEIIRFQGKMLSNQQAANDAMIFGTSSISAGFGAASFAFTYPFSSTPVVLYSLQSAGTAVAHDLSVIDNTGFTVAWATGTTAKFITWAAFRV